jgi:hypothetical protein
MDADQQLFVREDRKVDVAKLELVGRPVDVLKDRLHAVFASAFGALGTLGALKGGLPVRCDY